MTHTRSVESRHNETTDVRDAVRFTVQVTALAMLFVFGAATWLSTCGTEVDTAACSAPQRLGFAFGAPLILLAGGIWAFARTYRTWRAFGKFWAWQGAGWFLCCLMLLVLTMATPSMAAPVFGG